MCFIGFEHKISVLIGSSPVFFTYLGLESLTGSEPSRFELEPARKPRAYFLALRTTDESFSPILAPISLTLHTGVIIVELASDEFVRPKC